MAWGLASFAGPAVGGQVLQRCGDDWLWGGCFSLGACLAIGHYVVVQRAEPRPDRGKRAQGALVERRQ
jgi:MFS family permease